MVLRTEGRRGWRWAVVTQRNMLTIFATPKPFRGHFDVIQRNALRSWSHISPRPEIILFGDEQGTADVASELGVRHVPVIPRNACGAPLISLFEAAQAVSSHELLCYVNADVILMDDFTNAVQTVWERERRFLMVGKVWHVYIDRTLDFSVADSPGRLRDYVLRHGAQPPPPGNSDYFVFPHGLWARFPPIAIGRGFWEAWLIFEARRLGVPVVDASSTVMAVHQGHDQSVYSHGLRRWREEISRNYELVGKDASRFTLLDATHQLTSVGLRRNHGFRHFIRRLDTLPLFRPSTSVPISVARMPIKAMRILRARTRRARDPLYRLSRLVLSNLPQDGITAILGLAEQRDPIGRNRTRGLMLAHFLLSIGYPVVAYDPDLTVVEQARRALSGPLEFASSIEGCLKEGDVIVLASPRDEFRRLPLRALARERAPRILVDCCRLLQADQVAGIARLIHWP